jgi:hypothetical protein
MVVPFKELKKKKDQEKRKVLYCADYLIMVEGKVNGKPLRSSRLKKKRSRKKKSTLLC